MAKKYVKDYRISESMDAGGKLRTEYEYVGGSFYLTEGTQTVRKKARLLCIFCAVGWAAWLLPLLFNNGAMHIAFISFPYLFCALTLWLMSTAAYTAFTVCEPMKRRQSDRLRNLLPGSSLATVILSSVSLLGIVVSLIFHIGTLNANDWLFGICAAVLLAASVTAFCHRRFFRTEER